MQFIVVWKANGKPANVFQRNVVPKVAAAPTPPVHRSPVTGHIETPEITSARATMNAKKQAEKISAQPHAQVSMAEFQLMCEAWHAQHSKSSIQPDYFFPCQHNIDCLSNCIEELIETHQIEPTFAGLNAAFKYLRENGFLFDYKSAQRVRGGMNTAPKMWPPYVPPTDTNQPRMLNAHMISPEDRTTLRKLPYAELAAIVQS